MSDQTHERELLIEKLNAIEKWLGSTEALEHIYKSSNFTNEFLQLTLRTLITFKPDKFKSNELRAMIFKILYRIKIKEFSHYKKLIDLIIETLKHDNTSNVSLAIKCMVVIVKKIQLEESQLFDLVSSFSFMIDDFMNSFRLGDDLRFGQSLHLLSDIIPFVALVLRLYPNQSDKFEKITRDLFTFSLLFMKNNEFSSIVTNSEIIMIELINTLYRVVKYLIEIYITTGKDYGTKHAVPETCMFIMNFCPDSAENLKKDIYQQFTNYTIKHKELFISYIDIMISENILLKYGPIGLRIKGCFHSTEIATYFKDRVGKETLINLIQKICTLIEIEFKGHECNLPDDKNRKPVFYFNNDSIESLKILVSSLIKATDVILHQKFTYYEKHTLYMKVFYEVSKIFCGVAAFVETSSDLSDSKTLVKICIRGLKNLMNHFGTIKENTQTLIHSLKCFSLEEIAKFSRIFNYSLRLFTTAIFTDEDIYLYEDLYTIFIYLEEQYFYSIISMNLNFLISQTEKNPILFPVWRFYLGIKTTAPTIFASIMAYFISNESRIVDMGFIQNGFDCLFFALQAFPREMDHIFSKKIEDLLVFLMVTDEMCFYRYTILKSLLNHMERVKNNIPSTLRLFTNKLDWIIRILLKLFCHYRENHVFVELILIIPRLFVFIISKFKILIDPLIYALETESLNEAALELLLICVENLQPEFIVENSNNRLNTVMALVLECTKNEKLRDLALEIFFKYKGKTFIDEFKVSSNKQKYVYKLFMKNEDVKINVDLVLEKCIEICRGKTINIPLDDLIPNKIIIVDFKKTTSTGSSNPAEIKASFDFLCAFIYVSIGWENYEEIGVIEKIIEHFKEIELLGLALQHANNKKFFNEMAKHSHFIRIHNINIFEIIQAKQYIYDAIIAIFSIDCLGLNPEVIEFLKAIYLIVVVYRIIEQFRLYDRKTKIHFDYMSFIDPLLECFGKDALIQKAEEITFFIYEKLYEVCGSKELIRNVFIFHDILSKLITFCYFQNGEKKRAGLRGIIFMIKKIDLEQKFIHNHRCQIFRALFFYMQTASSAEIKTIKEILFFVLEKTYLLSNHDLDKHDVTEDRLVANESSLKNLRDMQSGFEAVNPDIVFQFIIGIRNTCQGVREISFECIEYFSKLRGITKSELLSTYKSIITQRLLDRAVIQKDTLTLLSHLDGLSYVLLIRPTVIEIDDNLVQLIQIIIKKFDNFSETKNPGKIIQILSCYLKFLENALDLITDGGLVEEIIILLIRCIFLMGEISEKSSKILKTTSTKHPEKTNRLFALYFKPQLKAFLHEKIDMNVINVMICILSTGMPIDPKELIDKLSEIFKIRGDIVLFKGLEITSLLPPNLPEIFLNEIVDVAYFLEQRNKLINNKKLKMIFRDICERNLAIIKHLIKRINDFCIYKIVIFLVKNSSNIKNNIKEILHVDENLYSILLAKEVGVRFTPAMCCATVKVYQDLRNRNKDCNAIRNIMRSLDFTGEYVNVVYEIDAEFVFTDPKKKILLQNLNFYSRRKLIESVYLFCDWAHSKTVELKAINDLDHLNVQFFTLLEGLLDTGIDMDLRGKIIMLFYNQRVVSGRAIYHCNLIMQKSATANHKAILYLSLVEPTVKLFEHIIYTHYEFKEYIEKVIGHLIDAFDPECFEEMILTNLKDPLSYRNHLFVIYPMLIKHPSLLSLKLTFEVFDAICRLFSTTLMLHQKIAFGLFDKIKEKYEYVFTIQDPSDQEKNIAQGLSIAYALFFSHICHSKDDSQLTQISDVEIPMNFSFLFFVEDNLNYVSLSRAIQLEVSKYQNEETDDESVLTYKQKLLFTFNLYIRMCFFDIYIHKSFPSYVDSPFLLQCINNYYETGSNSKTIAIVLIHILELRSKDVDVLTDDFNLFEVFTRVVNFIHTVYPELTDELIEWFIKISGKINQNYKLIKFFESLLTDKSFTRSNLIIENSCFLLEDPTVNLIDKVSFINSFRFHEDLNLSFVLPLLKRGCELMPVLQLTFLKGLKCSDAFLRDEFFDILNVSISTGIFSRLRYLLNFNWVLHGDGWLYSFLRLCMMPLNNLSIETFIVCVPGDDSFYENIYHQKYTTDKSTIKMHRLDVKIDDFIANNIDGFMSKIKKFRGSDITKNILDIMFHDQSLLNNFAVEILFTLFKKLNESEMAIIVEDVLQLTIKQDDAENTGVLFRALNRLVLHYQCLDDKLTDIFMSGQKIITVIREILSRPGFIKYIRKTNCFVTYLNLVTDEARKDVYLEIKEEEFRIGLLKTRSKFPETLNGLCLMQQGEYQKAIDIFEDLHMKAKNKEILFDAEEYNILEKEWIESAKKLQQWDVLQDLGNSIGDCTMSTEAAFRNCDFFLPNEISGVVSVLNIRKNSSEKRFLDVFIEFMTSPEKICGSIHGKNVIDNKLEMLKGDFIRDIHSYPLTSSKISEFLTYLKCIDDMIRFPPSFDLISDCENILNWDFFTNFRIHVLNLLIRIDPVKKFFHEKAKVLYAFCKALRREKLTEPALYFLQKIFILPSIEAVDAYKKILSEVKIYSENGYYENALEVLNSCNLNFFDNSKKANVFAWKARVYDKKGDADEAHRNILHSIQIDSNIGKNWYTWGLFLDKKIDKIMENITTPELLNEDGDSHVEKTQQRLDLDTCLENTFTSFLQAAIQTSGSLSRKSILRLLKYLRYETPGIISVFETQKDEIDMTRFFFFIPQLIALFDTNSHHCSQAILMKLIENYPQSMFLPLRARMSKNTRAYIIADNSNKGFANAPFAENNTDNEVVESKEDVNQVIKNLFGASSFFLASTFFTLEGIVTNIIEKMDCTVEEDCYKISDALFNESITMIFGESSFSFQDLSILINRLILVIKQSQIRNEFKNQLKTDFCDSGNLTLIEVARIALKWKDIIENVLINIPILLNLAVIKTLNEYGSTHLSDIHMFGQYSEIKTVYDDFVLIEGFEPAHLTGWKNGNCIKKIIVLGSDGKKYNFAFCDPVSDVYQREDRCIQMADFLDCDAKYKLKLKSYVNLSEKYRLVKLYEPFLFLDDMICFSKNRQARPDTLIMKFIDELIEIYESDPEQHHIPEEKALQSNMLLSNNGQDTYKIIFTKYVFTAKHKHEAYARIVSLFGVDNISSFYREIYPADETYYFFRKEILKNYSVQIIFFFLLSIVSRSPNRIAFGYENGKIYNLDIFSCLSEQFEHDAIEKTPFRLTPNLQEFFGYDGLEGLFSVIGSTLCKELEVNDFFKDLCLIFLEEQKCSTNDMFLSCKHKNILHRISIVNKDLTKLIKNSTNPNNLCLMNPLWHPWF